MKKYITAILAVTLILSLASCGNNNDSGNGGSGSGNQGSTSNNMGNAATDITDGIDNAATDMTDGTVFDTDKNYNVDDYTANAPGVTK